MLARHISMFSTKKISVRSILHDSLKRELLGGRPLTGNPQAERGTVGQGRSLRRHKPAECMGCEFLTFSGGANPLAGIRAGAARNLLWRRAVPTATTFEGALVALEGIVTSRRIAT